MMAPTKLIEVILKILFHDKGESRAKPLPKMQINHLFQPLKCCGFERFFVFHDGKLLCGQNKQSNLGLEELVIGSFNYY